MTLFFSDPYVLLGILLSRTAIFSLFPCVVNHVSQDNQSNDLYGAIIILIQRCLLVCISAYLPSLLLFLISFWSLFVVFIVSPEFDMLFKISNLQRIGGSL